MMGSTVKNFIAQNAIDMEMYQKHHCCFCNKRLSVGPIYFGAIVGYFCGRCVNEAKILISHGVLQPATDYERLAKHWKFLCSNAPVCSAVLEWGTVLKHEIACQPTIKCPMMVANCNEQMAFKDLRKHLFDCHRPNHYKQKTKFFFINESGNTTMCFAEDFGQVFLISAQYLKSSYKVVCSLLTDTDFKQYKYIVQIKCTICSSSNSCVITNLLNPQEVTNALPMRRSFGMVKLPCTCESRHTAYTLSVEIEFTTDRSPNKQAVTDLISNYQTLSQSNRNLLNVTSVSNAKVLKVIECPVCINYMKPPIFNCTRGHSICQDCKNSLNDTCPTCRSQLTISRNFPLESLSELIEYPCKFEEYGCYQKFPLNIANSHALNCLYRTLECPTTTCKDLVCFRKIESHFLDNHPTLQFNTANKLNVRIPSDQKMMLCNYTVLGDKLFILKLQCDGKTLPIKFDCVQVCMTESDAQETYKFKLQFFGVGNSEGLESTFEQLCKKDPTKLGNAPLVLYIESLYEFIIKTPTPSISFKCTISKLK